MGAELKIDGNLDPFLFSEDSDEDSDETRDAEKDDSEWRGRDRE